MAGGANVYGFAGGDPVNFADPFGLKPCRVTGSWGSATVDESVAADFLIAMSRANRGGYRGRINSSYRSSARQH